MAKIVIDPITGKKIERWDNETNSFSTQEEPTQTHTSATSDVANAQQKAGYKKTARKKGKGLDYYLLIAQLILYKFSIKKENLLAYYSFVFGLVSLISIIDADYGFSGIFTILSLVFGIIGYKRNRNKLAVVGIIMAIISIVIGAIILYGLISSQLVGVTVVTTNIN